MPAYTLLENVIHTYLCKVVFELCEAVFLVGLAHVRYSGVQLNVVIPAAGPQTHQSEVTLPSGQTQYGAFHTGLPDSPGL